jgi:hypothetical protein
MLTTTQDWVMTAFSSSVNSRTWLDTESRTAAQLKCFLVHELGNIRTTASKSNIRKRLRLSIGDDDLINTVCYTTSENSRVFSEVN